MSVFSITGGVQLSGLTIFAKDLFDGFWEDWLDVNWENQIFENWEDIN